VKEETGVTKGRSESVARVSYYGAFTGGERPTGIGVGQNSEKPWVKIAEERERRAEKKQKVGKRTSKCLPHSLLLR